MIDRKALNHVAERTGFVGRYYWFIERIIEEYLAATSDDKELYAKDIPSTDLVDMIIDSQKGAALPLLLKNKNEKPPLPSKYSRNPPFHSS